MKHTNGMATRPHLIGMAVTAGVVGLGPLAWGVSAGGAAADRSVLTSRAEPR